MWIVSAALTLLLVMDPVGNVPLFAALLKNVDRARWSWVILRENLIALVALLFFLLAGPMLMRYLGIEEPALNIAGGLVLVIIALRMIFPERGGLTSDEAGGGEPLVVPMAIPLIAGPSAMATVMLMATRAPQRRLECVGALVSAWVVGCAILLAAGRLQRLLGRRGLVAVERLMGMILIVVAVQMSMTGVERFVADLHA